MAAATPIPLQMPYSRRVSFSNIKPDDLESGVPPDVTRFHSYSMAPKTEAPIIQEPELAKLFSSYSFSSKPFTQRTKQKLPNPPSKSILKNKLSREQVKLNINHAAQNGVPLSPNLMSGEIDSVAIGDESDSDSDGDSPLASPPESRRKSYSNMTYDELLALDPQFSKPNKSNLDDFKFDPLGTTFSTQRRGSSAGTSLLAATAKSKAIAYPTSNENNYKSVSLTVKHQDFDHDDEAAHRTILTVISGRKHTWNALDWLLLTDESLVGTQPFLQNGDHLVVSALVPLKYLQAESKGTSKKKDCPEKRVQQKGEDILAYILNNIPNTGLKLKITVELVMDVSFPDPVTLATSASKKVQTGTKFMMSHLFKQYQPTLVVVGNKSTSLNFKYPRRKSKSTTTTTPRSSISAGSSIGGKVTDTEFDQYLVKLSSYFVRYSTVPVIMVGNSTIFHKKPPPKYMPSVTFRDESSKQQGILDAAPSAQRHDSYCSDVSIESFCGERSNGCHSESSSLVSSSKSPPSVSSKPADRFAAMLMTISSASLFESKTYLEQIRADKFPPHFADSKVHQAYVSMESGRHTLLSKTNSIGAPGRAYKVKSLISYNEEDEKKNERKIKNKKLKQSISQGSTGSAPSGELEDQTKVTKIKNLFLRKLGRKK